MNRLYAVVTTCVLLVSVYVNGNAQGFSNNIVLSNVDAYPIGVSCEQTTNLIFPFSIKSVDRGSTWVLAQKAKGAENVLQLKAGRKDFTETNVSVICADGQLYSFLLHYVPFPPSLNIKIEKNTDRDSLEAFVQLTGQPLGANAYLSVSESIAKLPAFLRLHTREQLLCWHLKGIYLARDVLWFSTRLSNGSLIHFTPSPARFFIRDRKRGKRTAIQEREIIPVYHNADSTVGGKNCRSMVFAFQPFAIPKAQQLIMEVTEKDGGRKLMLRVKAKWLLCARTAN